VGVLAAVAWAVAPNIIYRTIFGHPQPYELLFNLMAFYFALLALEKQSPRWAVGSVITGLFGVIFKYTGFTILGLGVGVAMWHWRKNPRLWRNALLIQIVAIILCAIFLFTLGGALELFGADHRESDAFASGGFLRVFDVNLGLRLINNAIIQINMPMVTYTVLVIVGSIVYMVSI